MTLYNNFLLKRGVGLFSGVGLISGDYGTSDQLHLVLRVVQLAVGRLLLLPPLLCAKELFQREVNWKQWF